MSRIFFLMPKSSLFHFSSNIFQCFMVYEYEQCLQSDRWADRNNRVSFTQTRWPPVSRTDFGWTRQHFGDVRRLTTGRRASDCHGNRRSIAISHRCSNLRQHCFKTVTSFFALGVKIPNAPLVSWPPVQKQKTSAFQNKANGIIPDKGMALRPFTWIYLTRGWNDACIGLGY